MDNLVFYDIFSSSDTAPLTYEGTLRLEGRYMSYDKMMEVACLEKNYPNVVNKQNVQFIEQGTPKWNEIMEYFKK